MKRKIIALFTAAFILGGQVTNAYAEDSQPKEIQLTDYRYTSATHGLYGYNFFNGYFDFEGRLPAINSDKDSVILKPDGTELFQQGKYAVIVLFCDSYVWGNSQYMLCFPQYEKRFLVRKRDKPSGTCVLDEDGNELIFWKRGFFGGMFLNDNICVFTGLGNTYPYIDQVYAVLKFANIETGNFVVPTEDEEYREPELPNDGLGLAADAMRGEPSYIEISKDGKYFKIIAPGNEPFYYNVSGVKENPPEGTEFEPAHTDNEYYQVEPGKYITTDKMDRSYIFKEKSIGGKTYYALFKTLSDDESPEDYKPKEQPSPWAVDTINKATAEGLLYNNANCRYKANMSRQDFAVLAVEAYCKSQGMEIDEFVKKNNITFDFDKFSDTDNVYILLADYLDIAKGTSATTFSPDRGITRQEAAVMLNNIAKLAGVKANSDRINYTDNAKFSNWADDAIYNVSSIRTKDGVPVMSGMAEGIFSPWSLYSREQAYVSVYRLYVACSDK